MSAVMSAVMQTFRRLAGSTLDTCYPGICVRCLALCADAGPLCDPCAASLDNLLAHPACPRCARPVAGDGFPCPWCLGKGLRPFSRIARLGIYQQDIRPIIHRMKYGRQWSLAEFLAEKLLEKPDVRAILADADLLVPVPLHWWKHWSRGYNQADLLARRLARAHPSLRTIHAVRRVRFTESQAGLTSQAARRQNVKRAFALRRWRSRALAGRRIVIIDDVMTTGATIQTVARALRPARPASISAIVIAVADPRGRRFQFV